MSRSLGETGPKGRKMERGEAGPGKPAPWTARRVTPAIAVVALCLTAGSGPAPAAGLTGTEIERLLTGNTLFHQYIDGDGRLVDAWDYFKDDRTKIRITLTHGRRSFRERAHTGSWRATDDGRFCYSDQRNRDVCHRNIKVTGDVVRMDGANGSPNRRFKLLKGSPQGF